MKVSRRRKGFFFLSGLILLLFCNLSASGRSQDPGVTVRGIAYFHNGTRWDTDVIQMKYPGRDWFEVGVSDNTPFYWCGGWNWFFNRATDCQTYVYNYAVAGVPRNVIALVQIRNTRTGAVSRAAVATSDIRSGGDTYNNIARVRQDLRF